MSKKLEQQAHDETVKQQGASNTNYNALRGENTQVGTNRDDEIYGGYKNLADTGGVDPAAKAALLGTSNFGASGGSGGGGGGGGAAVPRQDYFSGIGKLDKTQYDNAEAAFTNIDKTGAQNMADTGGLDAGAMDRMTGMGGFQEFAKTGGYTDEDKSNIRAKALSPISAFDTNMRNDMSTRRATQGGYSPGFDASSRALQRDTSRNIADTSLNAELGIKDKVNAGKQWGISGGAGAEQSAQQLKTGNELAGSQLKAQIETNIASGKMSAADGRARIAEVQQQTDLATASGRTQRDIAEMQVAAANGNAAASRELAKAELAAQNQRFTMELEQSGKIAGLGGMNSVYGNNMDRELNIDNSQSGSNVSFGGLRGQQADQIGGPMDALSTGLNLGAGALGAFDGLGGGSKSVRPPTYADYSRGINSKGYF